MKQHALLTLVAICIANTVMAHEDAIPNDTINELVVTGTNQSMQRRLLPYSVSTISNKQIEATGHTQLLSALSCRVPGLFVTERNIFGFGVSNGGSGGIKLRGVGGSPTNQVLMMVDGKPQFASVFSHHVADNYETEYIDHVEVVRGPASVLYGSNAMGGAINVITSTPRKDGVHTTIKSQYGMYNTSQSSATNSVRKGRFSSLVSIGYDRTDGTEKNFDFWQASGYAKVGYEFSKHWNGYADYSVMKFEGNDPIYARLSNPESKDVYHQNVVRGEASAVVDNRYDKTNGAMRIYYGHGDNKINDPKAFQMLDSRIGVLAYQNYSPWQNTNLTLGFDFDRYTGEVPLSGGEYRKDKVTPATMGQRDITEYSPYITASQGLWKNILVLNAGVRMANSNHFGTQWIPQAGLTVNPGCDWTIKANLARGYRNPSFKELYMYKMANPDLKAESMMNYEVSLSKRFGHYLTLELTGYLSKGSDLIQQVFNTELGSNHNENTGSFCNKGIELAASSRPIRTLALSATYSYLHTDLKNLTAAPKHQYSVGADWMVIPKLNICADLVGIRGLYVASDVKKQDYALLNMKVSYQCLPWLNIFAMGHNIANAHYCINKGYTMPGANVSGGVKFQF